MMRVTPQGQTIWEHTYARTYARKEQVSLVLLPVAAPPVCCAPSPHRSSAHRAEWVGVWAGVGSGICFVLPFPPPTPSFTHPPIRPVKFGDAARGSPYVVIASVAVAAEAPVPRFAQAVSAHRELAAVDGRSQHSILLPTAGADVRLLLAPHGGQVGL